MDHDSILHSQFNSDPALTLFEAEHAASPLSQAAAGFIVPEVCQVKLTAEQELLNSWILVLLSVVNVKLHMDSPLVAAMITGSAASQWKSKDVTQLLIAFAKVFRAATSDQVQKNM